MTDASAFLTEIIDHFAHAEDGPGGDWAHADDFTSYSLDYQSKDGAKFWIDLYTSGTIHILWKPAGQDEPKVMIFTDIKPMREI